MAVSHFSSQFQISAGAETSHVIVITLQPGGQSEISAWAEFRHVIGLIIFFFSIHKSKSKTFFFFFRILSTRSVRLQSITHYLLNYYINQVKMSRTKRG